MFYYLINIIIIILYNNIFLIIKMCKLKFIQGVIKMLLLFTW